MPGVRYPTADQVKYRCRPGRVSLIDANQRAAADTAFLSSDGWSNSLDAGWVVDVLEGVWAKGNLESASRLCVWIFGIYFRWAGLLVRSFMRLANVPPGFNPQHMVSMNVSEHTSRSPYFSAM